MARLNTAINAEDAEAGDVHYQTSCYIKHNYYSHNQREEDIRQRGTVAVFPIFCDTASTMAMQKHAMFVTKKAIEFVNPGHVPVIEGDCPLYA